MNRPMNRRDFLNRTVAVAGLATAALAADASGPNEKVRGGNPARRPIAPSEQRVQTPSTIAKTGASVTA